MPRYIAEKFEKIQRTFLWLRIEEKNKFSLVKWDTVCQPKNHGGLGIRIIYNTNKDLMAKVGWDHLRDRKDWCKIMNAKYLHNKPLIDCLSETHPSGSLDWRCICSLQDLLRSEIKWKIGMAIKSDSRRTPSYLTLPWKTLNSGIL